MLTAWIKNPITQEMLRITEEHLNTNRKYMTDLVINGPSLGQQDLHVLSQIKGQILAFETVLDTKEYLIELTEEEVKNES